MSQKQTIESQNAAQQRGFIMLVAMLSVIGVGALIYVIMTLSLNRRVPANPDASYTGANGITVQYESAKWPVQHMNEESSLGAALEIASGEDSDSNQYQVVLFQRGDASTYPDYIKKSEDDLRVSYGVIKPRKVNLKIDGATVEAVRCDIQIYYAVLATITYDSGDVVYVSGLTKLASINDIVNLVESVTLE